MARTAAGLPAPSRGWETETGFGLSWGLETVPVSPGATDGSDFVGFSGVSAVTGAWVAHDDHFRHVSTYDLEILDDMIAEPEEGLSLSLGASTLPLTWGSYLDLNCPDVSCLHTVTITDDDTAGVTVNPTSLLIDEGNSATYTVVLVSQPTDTVTVTVNDPADNTDVTAEPASLDFTTTDWSTAQTVTVSAAQDDDSDNEMATVTHTVTSTDPNYSGISASSVTVSVTDDEDPAVSVSFGQAAYTVAESDDTATTEVQENQAAITVKLSADPERTVTILITQAPQGGAISADYSGVPENVTFNSGDTEKSFTFTATADSVDDDGESVKLAFGTLPTAVSEGTANEAVVSHHR